MTTTPFSSRKLSPAQLELLERRLRGAGGTGRGIPARPIEQPIPLSPAQHGLWVVGQFLADNTLYSVHRELWLRGPLDANALRRALDELVRRHEILRTVYRGDTEAFQVVGPARGAVFEVVDAADPDRGRDRAVELAGAELRRPFDLERGPVFRATLFRVSAGEHLLVLNMHHMVSDGWSCGVLGRELGELYSAYARDLPHGLPELPIQYADYAYWQAGRLDGDLRERQLDHWRDALDGVASVLQLPTDHPHPARPSHRAGRVSRELPAELSAAVRDLATRGGVTLFTVLLAAFDVVLARCSGQDTFAVGSLTSGRELAEVEHLLGLFANTVAIPADLSGDPTFTELLARTHRTVLGALGHQDVSFEQVVAAVQPARDPSRNPLFQVLFQLVQIDEENWEFGGLDVEAADLHNESGKVDLALFATDHGDRIELEIEYAKDLFEPVTGAWYAERVLTVLTQVAADPDRPLSSVDVLPDTERELVVSAWNATDLEVPRTTLGELFAAEARRVPEATAVVDVDGSVVTYAELNARANRLAHHLRDVGVRCESVVGVCVEHSVDMLVALLGVLKAGGAYVPLDPGLPGERLSYMLEDTEARVVVTQGAVACSVPPEFDGDVVTLDDDPSPFDGCPDTDPAPVNGPDNLVYVMYTSGSTGRPKGVMISHHGLINYLWWAVEGYGLEGEHGAPMLGSIAFDLSVPNFFLPLIGGRDVTLLPKDRSLEALAGLLRAPGDYSLLKLTPGHLDVLRGMIPEPGAVDSVRTFVVGADEVRPETVVAWQKIAPNARIIDEYGPTETVVGCSIYTVDDDFDPSVPVSIGRPIANTQMYVLDGGFGPVPVGVVGELFIGGFGVARGYLNRRGLTADKFVPDPFSATEGARMYRTGDLARFRADGNLEFLGRIDHQVKIRGYRIELGEIEARLLLHPGVSEAVVVARRDASGNKRLVAYLVTGAEAAEVREFVARALPDYMVPTAWVVLPEMPLTAAGKVDRDALPEPSGDRDESMGGYVAARTPAETTLAEIWSQALGVDRVGVHDDFFELGGDSILAIQIVAHARRAGLSVSVRQVFERRTVGGLAELAVDEVVEVNADQHAVSGPVELTPMLRWFTEQRLRHDHYNQAVLVECGPAAEPAVLERALAALVGHHDALRTRMACRDGEWRAEIAPDEEHPLLRVVDLSGVPEEEREGVRELVGEEVQSGLSLTGGPIVAAALFTGADGLDLLLIAIHHVAVDTVSWNILLEDLESACAQIEDGGPVRLPAKSTSFQHWAHRLGEHARSEDFAAEAARWTIGRPAAAIPADHERGPNTQESVRTVDVTLPADVTDALVRRVPSAYRTEINDVLLTALARTLTEWTGGRDALVEVEGHGREPLFDDVDLSRTVGWFTTLVPVGLTLPDGGWDVRLKAVKEQVRGALRGGIGHGLARHLRAGTADALAAEPSPGLSFNYLGRMDRQRIAARRFTEAGDPPGSTRDPLCVRPVLIEVNAEIRDDVLLLSWSYSQNRHEDATVRRLAERYVAFLTELVAHCTSPGGQGATPGDFPLTALDQPAVDRLLGHLGDVAGVSPAEVEDVYPLSPLQAGMVFNALYDADPDDYFEQLGFVLRGRLDADAFERAWQQVARRHSVLRTLYVWEGLPAPVQVVLRRPPVRFETVDRTGVDPAEVPALLRELMRDLRREGFDLAAGCPSRLTLVSTALEEHHFVWSFHHIMLDAWSVSAVFDEVFAVYEALRDGRSATLNAPVSYRDHIAWLAGRDRGADEAFWRARLDGFAGPAALPAGTTADDATGVGRVQVELPASLAEDVRALAHRCGATAGTVLHAAWALLAGRYTGSRDVLFGTTVTGRSAGVTGVERLVGLLINTLPTRVELRPDLPVTEFLAGRQAAQLELRDHEHSSLAEVQRLAGVPAGTRLFDTIFSYENFAGDGRPVAGIELEPLGEMFEQTDCPLVIEVNHHDTITVTAIHRRDSFDRDTCARMLADYRTLVRGMVEHPDAPLSSLETMDAAARDAVLAHARGAEVALPDRPVHALVSERARLSPDATAVRYGDRRLTYREFDTRANRIAHELAARGVTRGSMVGVCLRRSEHLPVVLLGVLKAGAAYLPLDADYPAERLEFMLTDAGATAVVTEDDFAPRLPTREAGIPGTAVVRLDADAGAIAARPGTDPGVPSGGRDLAYVIYTSGSTGTPKSVAIEHAAVVWLVHADYVRLGPDDVVAQASDPTFDAVTFEIWGALVSGAELTGIPKDTVLSPELLSATLRRERVSVMYLTTALFNQLAGTDPSVFSSLDTLLFGGDAVNRQRVERVLAADPPRRLLHMYGPTETTAYCTWTRIGDLTGSPTVSIGRPMVNTQAYVLDDRLEPVPFGVVGEIWIGGLGVARGYLGRPGLTAERFVPDPFSAVPGARMYRTGDTGWLRADGMLEFQGRIDRQTKVRGYRIELGEIEARLAAHPAVRDAVVDVRSEGPAHKRLVAYVVPEAGEQPGTGDLREFLERSLPDYMVPAAWVTLDRLPLTSANKVDRRALPDPDDTRDAVEVEYRAPGTAAERALAEVWARVLGVDRVGADDDFFELGGDSILAIQVVSGARQAGVALTVREVFEHRTVGALGAVAEPAVAPEPEPEAPAEPAGFPLSGLDEESLGRVTHGREVEDVYRLSPLQAGMLVESLAADGPDPYFRQWAWDLSGALDVGVFGRAWQHVVDRHPILRTHFAWEGLSHPVQVVSRAFPVTMERWDCRSEADRGTWLDRLMADERERGVALAGAPPLRLVVVRTGDRSHRFVWNTHHVLIDGWSRTLILDEVFAVYRALAAGGRTPALPAAVPFRDFVAWLDRDPADAAAYWAGAFDGFAGPTAPPLAGGARPNGSMGVADHVPAAELTAAWRATARRYGVTAGTVAQAAWALLLGSHGDSADVAFGVTVAGRSIDLPGVERVAGMLINTVPERTVIDPACGVGEWLRSLHDAHVARQPHEHHALTDIHRWAGAPAGRSMFDTRFVFEGSAGQGADGDGGPDVTEVTAMGGEVEYPLVLAVSGGDDAAVQLRYDQGCYDEPTALRLLAEYVRLLGALTGAAAETRLDALASLPEPSRGARVEPAAERRPATAPRTPDERTLAGIWTEILGVTDVGVHDDFFDLGGDSILVFRVVTRAREAGLRLTVRQALRQRTIAELAAAVAGAPEPVPVRDDEPTGDVPLTPVLRRFTAQDIDHDHHNQAMLLSWYQDPDPDLLDGALRAVVAHHEALRFRLARDGGEWRLTVADPDAAALLRVVDLPADGGDAVVREVADEINADMDLAAGSLVRAVLFRDAAGSRLLVAVHHVAVDTVSWSILLDDLAEAYRRLVAGERPELPETGTSYRSWARRLAEYAGAGWFAEESAYWLAPRPAAPSLPLDRPDGANTQDSEHELETMLSADATEALLRDAPKVLGCRIDEVLLGAVAYALSRWTGADGTTVDVEGHGREPLTDDVDLARTVGWFTSVHPVHLHLPATGGPSRRAAAVREQLRAVPHRGVSYGLARHLLEDTAAVLAGRSGAQVIVTHHGQRSGHPDPRALFDATTDTPGTLRGPANRRPYPLAVDTAVVGGRAVVSWTYSATLHDRATIERVMGLCVDELEALAGLCRLGSGAAPPRREGEPGRLAERLFPHAPAVVTPMARHRAPGAGIALIADGELVSAWGEGVTGGENPAPVGPDTVFQACSVSKHVTALGVMRLVQEGRLDLDRDIGRYLTSWDPPEGPITLRQVLSHTAGLSVFRHPGYRRGSRVPELRQVLDGAPPANTPRIRNERPPGDCRYSCGNYSVVEQVVVDVTGRPFAEAMRSLVLDPLGMDRSGYEQDLPDTRPGGVALGHLADGSPYDGGWRVFPELASSGLWATPGDLARVSLEIHRAATGAGGVFLSQELATEMVTPVDAGYGLGTTTVRDRDAHWFGHPGDKHSHQTLVATDLRSGVGLVAMFNIGGDAPVHADLLNELGVHFRYVIR